MHAIEKDANTLDCAKHNAEVYGVADKIKWYLGNAFDVLNESSQLQQISIVFASPPWGGRSNF